MNLLVNQLLCWQSDNEADTQIDRILWIDFSGTDVVTIDIYDPYAQPILQKHEHMMAAIAANRASILQEDPYAKILRYYVALNEEQRQRVDKAWSAIFLIVTQEESLFDPVKRSQLIKEAVKQTGRTEPTIRKDLRRYWQRGQTKNAIIPDFNKCGEKGKEKRSDGCKRGRKSFLAQARNEELGVNVDAEIEKKFRKGIRLFYETPQKRPLTKAFQLTLEKFFPIGYRELADGSKEPILPPAEKLPSLRQFQYWYEKSSDITRQLITRKGERRYNLSHRAIVGNSTQMAFGPGSLFQIDATIADVYLVSSLSRRWIIGRPTLYLVIDVFSRMIVGFVVTLEPSSWLGAMLALENATADKVEFCKKFDLEITEAEWPSHHLPEAILADRGEFEGYNANNLVDSLGVDVDNTPPYRADMKGIVEQSFNQLNNEAIHWLPGSVKKLPERGERDYRLDGVLTLYEFRQLMILAILDHNSEKRLNKYPMDEFMIQDELEPYPVDLWQWGAENRVGSLHWQPPENIRLNLLPTAEASVTREGCIYFKKLHYTCELAVRQQWFVKAKSKRSWKITVAYDPRLVDYIYIRLDSGKDMEVCRLLEVDQRFQGCDFREVEDYYRRQEVNKQASKTRRQQSKAKHNAQANKILDQATEEAKKTDDGQSKQSRIKNIRQNRNEERSHERKTEAWDLTPDKLPDQLAQVIPMPTIAQPDKDDEEYVAPHRPFDKLRQHVRGD
ncbi:Mu transposase C-terminal domain-containing protein [Coleofasciculus sp. FACHB-1120]|uniref:Mu transposase C-terminal domain-containing protein n=1 Tax=Coleofasciculus sp. FACHB-1120 TaxID=2692783 RepID=UPI001684A2EA|nr:Mu transposase C-terminal domain-containing protein [Coleofasciculus sp. FACHB-1120]MBD2741907.1 DDE-type integrase/transposase/recombinase [Coleofasciculus sp. FACHB-1120]